ncbi:pseudouridine synthase [Chitinophagaceae bacterium MMS25-I14]
MTESGHRYFAVYKPVNMVSQFVSSHEVNLLGNLEFDFPEGTHAIGRLDNDSEGLLLLTTNKKVTRLLFESETPHKRTYLVLVKNIVSPETLHLLQTGIPIKIKGGENYITTPCDVEIIKDPATVLKTLTPYDAHIPHTWLLITLTEGKFHQVRKMVFTSGHRCKRLIRVSIEDLHLGTLKAGEVHEMEEVTFFRLLQIHNY